LAKTASLDDSRLQSYDNIKLCAVFLEHPVRHRNGTTRVFSLNAYLRRSKLGAMFAFQRI